MPKIKYVYDSKGERVDHLERARLKRVLRNIDHAERRVLERLLTNTTHTGMSLNEKQRDEYGRAVEHLKKAREDHKRELKRYAPPTE